MSYTKLNYIHVPKERLMALQWLDLKSLSKDEIRFRATWKKNKRCNCVSFLDENELPSCVHIRNAIKEISKEKRERVWKRTLLIATKLYSSNKQINERFHRF